MILLQINQINKIKHSGSVSWKTKKKKKKHDLCVISMENQFFRCTQRAITQRRVITLGPIFIKMVLNQAQGLKKKVKRFQREKKNNRQRYNKKMSKGGADSPRLF